MGVGLAVISALAERAEFLSEPDAGTTVRMSFAGGASWFPSRPERVGRTADGGRDQTLRRCRRDRYAGGTARRILGRAARATAARAHFTVDRFAELTQ